MTTFDTDVLVVGAGAAGLVTALTARGRRVSILHAGDTASELAQGGIAAAVGADDTAPLHAADTRAAGHERNDDRAVRFACEHALDAIQWLETLGVRFARTRENQWSLHLEAAHSRARVLHADGDATGAAIMRVLRAQLAEAPHVELLPPMRARALLRSTSGIHGVTAVSDSGSPVRLRARDVVLATGGIGALYTRTTNPLDACGDGLAMALAAGARCDSLAAVQFHPTALDVDTRPLPLISEALRGAGARLIDASGKYIMQGRHPLGDLAPRDVVASVVYAEQLAGRQVWLDATVLQATDVAHSFPTAYRHCRDHGIDPHREPIAVTCAAHYHMGGVAVDLDGRTSLSRLWAVGEVACTGLHGTNRLASNSLLEAVTFGRRLGRVLGDARSAAPDTGTLEPLAMHDERIDDELRQLMWRCLGPLRTAAALAEGIATLAARRARLLQPAGSFAPHLQLVEAMLRAALPSIDQDLMTRSITPSHLDQALG
ncbi:MAG: FAD-binding protein [Steroidobacteraceae bacterium]